MRRQVFSQPLMKIIEMRFMVVSSVSNILSNVILAFAPGVHFELSQKILTHLGFSQDAISLHAQVQKCADSRFGQCGFKSNPYLMGGHYMWPTFKYAQTSCERAKAAILNNAMSSQTIYQDQTGTPNNLEISTVCTLDDFYIATELIVFEKIIGKHPKSLLQRELKYNKSHDFAAQQLRPASKRNILIALYILDHAVADRKHLEDSINADGINSIEHFTVNIGQVCSDLHPDATMQERSKIRSQKLYQRFQEQLKNLYGEKPGQQFWNEIKDYHLKAGVDVKNLIDPNWIRSIFPKFYESDFNL